MGNPRKDRVKGSLKDRQQQSAQNANNSGGGKNYLIMPDDVSFYKPKKGKNKIDIIPFIVKTDKHPNGIEKNSEDYLVDFYVHKSVGTKNDKFLCLKKTLGKSCPICEEQYKLYQDGEEDKAKALKAQRRVIYNIIDLNDKEKGIQLFETSHFLFEKEVQEKIKYVFEDEELPIIADLEDGKTISFRAVEKEIGKKTYFEFKDFDFENRTKPYKDSMLDDSIPLDTLFIIPTYDEVGKSFFSSGMEDDEDEEKTMYSEVKKSKNKKREQEDDDEDDEPEEFTDEEEGDEKPKKSKSYKNKCPEDLEFGEDFEMDDFCDDCDLRKECKEEWRKIKK